MSAKIEKISALKYQFYITLYVPKIEKLINKKILKIQKNSTINGFRIGKVPIEIIKNKYYNQTKQKLIQKIVTKKFFNMISEKKIKLFSYDDMFYKHNVKNNYLNYYIKFEIQPKFDLKLNKLKKIQKITYKNNNNYYKNIIKKINCLNSKKKTYQTIIDFNSIVTIDYSIFLNNEKKECYTIQNFSFIFGNNILDYKIEKKLLGKKKNNEVTVNFLFSKIHPEKKLQNQYSKIKIFIKSIEKNTYMLDFLFYNKEEQSMFITLEQKQKITFIQKKIKKYTTLKIEKYLKYQILHNLLFSNPIAIPTKFIEHEYKNLIHNLYYLYHNKIKNLLSHYSNTLLKLEAVRNAKIKILFNKIIKLNKLEIDLEKTKQLLQHFKEKYIKDKKKIANNKNDKKIINYLNNVLLEKKIFDILYSVFNIQKTEKSITDIFQNTLLNNIK
ncbi:hypothetical protein D9V80_01840 [Buchnera aphidicola (Thelaxes californica)]|uniref:Trigger factor n=1 Tax=Buchnera aphidicola (Thelaxes californica) TaxID=1315998 RepID=A0A4D6YP43_9GAMM|nr:trigger factor [Buchnera aphidicola]QCI26885.1 hypothetical protein D9V80_01840 [Buchnera aphidicola (Thelaxes californica)]